MNNMGFETSITQKYPLRSLYFYLTKDCNLRCRHCWVSPDFQTAETSGAYLPLDLFRSIIKEAKPMGLIGVKLTGGEPLLHPQIIDILYFIRDEGLCLNIETNAVLCTPEIAQAMASCQNLHVSISLDGANAKTHEWVRGVDGCFDAAIEGIKNLVNVGVRPQIIMSIMRHNRGEIDDLINLAISLQASSIKFNIVTPILRGEAMHKAGETLSIEELVELGDYIERVTVKGAKLPILFSHPPAFRHLDNMFGKHGIGCPNCHVLSILGVMADGTYALCGIGEAVPELTYGNAKSERLLDVWENAPFMIELREGLPSRFEDVCGDCILKNLCLGCCVAQNYYRKKSLWAPFWFCDEAKKSGLFPQSKIYSKNL